VSDRVNAADLQSAIEEALGEPLGGLQLLSQCSSTNAICRDSRVGKNIIIADTQTAGRGRRGNQWYSPPGQNIYCSIGVEKRIPAYALGLVSLLVGVCIAEELHAQGFAEVQLKWPNDIVVAGKKLGGILIESQPSRADRFYLVIGFGLNVQLDDATLAAIEQPAISLQQMARHPPARDQLLIPLVARILQQLKAFEVSEVEKVLQQFARHDCFISRPVRLKTPNGFIDGIYAGVHVDGQLMVETVQGLEMFSAAEISLRAG